MITEEELNRVNNNLVESFKDHIKLLNRRIDELKYDVEVRDGLLRKVIKQFGKNYDVCVEIADLLEVPWYNRIPEHGILVKDKDDPTSVLLIYNNDVNDDGYWQNGFEPLTNEEIERLKI